MQTFSQNVITWHKHAITVFTQQTVVYYTTKHEYCPNNPTKCHNYTR